MSTRDMQNISKLLVVVLKPLNRLQRLPTTLQSFWNSMLALQGQMNLLQRRV